MTIDELISSGIIERYVLGLASLEEREKFEKLCLEYPELAEAKRKYELSLESEALSEAITPPASVKENIFETIRAEDALQRMRSNELNETTIPTRKRTGIYLTVAACIVLLAGCLGLILFFYQKNEELQAEMISVETKKDSLYQRSNLLEEQLLGDKSMVQKSDFRIIQKGLPASITVFWDSTSSNVYLVIKNLAVLPQGQQYQLWSVASGKYKSMGLFDAPADRKLILKMNNMQHADSFTITIEERGKTAE